MMSVGVTVPFTVVGRAAEHQATCSSGRVMVWRAMASGGVQRNSSSSSSSHGSHNVPKLEPFNQSRISRLMREPSLLEKAEHALADRCVLLEGNEAYRCWEALFEFENIKEAYQGECAVASSEDRASACRPLERFENLVRQSGGVSGLIDNILMLAKTAKLQKEEPAKETKMDTRPVFPEDGGLPMDDVPVAGDESGLLPDSSLSRMLRHNGCSPAWYTHRPDHESD